MHFLIVNYRYQFLLLIDKVGGGGVEIDTDICIAFGVSKQVTWCFTPSQPLRLYQGEDLGGGGGGGERETDRQRQTETETERQRERSRRTERETKTESETMSEREG